MQRSYHKAKSGFTLIQLSVILTVASLIMVATLPGTQTTLNANKNSATKMDAITMALRQYQTVNGTLPCPADPTLAIGSSNYGVAAANSGSTNNCIGSTPAANYADSTTHIAIGMVPVKSLALSNDYALDGYSHDITYAVDTKATGCWAASSVQGGITVIDNGITQATVVALVSHGADGYGAWLPLPGNSGTASRLDNGSTDTSQADNAQVAHGGGTTANTTFASFVNQPATSTFDDAVVYRNKQFNLNQLPLTNGVPVMTPPANATYSKANILTFTLTYNSTVTVTGSPRLQLSALGTGSIGSSNIAYATYQSGSGTSTLTFQYTVQATDSAPTSGISVTAPVDLNSGTISGSTCFFPPDLSKVLISPVSVYISDANNNRVIILKTDGTYVKQLGCASGACTAGAGNTQLSHPRQVVIDNSGNIWITDAYNNRIVEYDSSGTYVSQFNGSAGSHTLSSPIGLAMDAGGNLWVADNGNSLVKEFTTAGTFLGSFAGSADAEFIAIDTGGNVWLSNCSTGWVKEYGSGSPYTYIQQTALASCAYGLSVDASNNLYVADSSGGHIRKYSASTAAGVNSFSGGTLSYFGSFNDVHDVSVDPSGNIWVAERGANDVKEYDSTGTLIRTITTFNGADTFTPHELTVGR